MHASDLLQLSPSKIDALLDSLTDDEAARLAYDWPVWARPEQLPPPGDWFVWLIMAGRGFGKTRAGAEWVIERARQGLGPIALIGETAADVRDTMVELGDSSILKISPPWFYPDYEPSKRRLTWPNGVTATTFSGDKPDQLRGPQHATVWADEPAKWRYADDAWDNMEFGLRLSSDPRCVATTTPRPITLIKGLVNDDACVVTGGSTYDNAANLSDRFRERLLSKYEGTRLGRQELHAELLMDNPGALWSRDEIQHITTSEVPDLKRIVVAVDPAVTHGPEADETGIVVCGVSPVGQAYVLEDASGHYSTNAWAQRVVRLYDRYQADRVVGEVNNGGDLVESNVRTARRNIAFKQVRATRGKQKRAEPVASLYQQGRVWHVGTFPQLEDQMTQWDPDDAGGDSPDRMDALVWGLAELMLRPASMKGKGLTVHL